MIEGFKISHAFIAICLVAIAITGCSAEKEPDYFSLPEAQRQPPAGMAQLVFYYPPSSFWSGITANVELQGQAVCGLKNGSFAIRNIRPDPRTAIVISLCSTNGASRLTLKTVANMKYYIRIVPNDQTVTGLIARRHLNGSMATRKVIPGHGAFWVDPMDEAPANKELRGLQLCRQCV